MTMGGDANAPKVNNRRVVVWGPFLSTAIDRPHTSQQIDSIDRMGA